MVAKMIYEARALTWALKKAEFNNNQIWYCPCYFFPSYARILVFSVYKETLTEDDFLTKYCLPSVQLSFPNLLLTKQVALPSSSQCGFLIKQPGKKNATHARESLRGSFSNEKGEASKTNARALHVFWFSIAWLGRRRAKENQWPDSQLENLKCFPKKIIFGLSRFF